MDKNKILLIICLIGTVILSVYLTVSLVEMKQSLQDTQSKLDNSSIQMKQLEESIIRSQSSLVTSKQLDKALSNLGLSKIQSDLNTLGAKVDLINVVLVKTPGFYGTNIPSSGQTPGKKPIIPPVLPCEGTGSSPSGPLPGGCINPDKFGYLNNEQLLSLNEPFKGSVVPFGSTSFKAWEQKPWSLEIFPRSYSVKNVVAKDEDGNSIVYNQFEIEVKGKKYPVEIASSTSIQEAPESHFWFNPKVYLGVGVGPTVTPEIRAEVVPSVGVSLFSYGPNKSQSTWSFLGLGVGAHTQELSPVVTISPANYNIGEPIPLLENLFIGPMVSVDIKANVAISGSVQVGL